MGSLESLSSLTILQLDLQNSVLSSTVSVNDIFTSLVFLKIVFRFAILQLFPESWVSSHLYRDGASMAVASTSSLSVPAHSASERLGVMTKYVDSCIKLLHTKRMLPFALLTMMFIRSSMMISCAREIRN